MKSLYIRFYRFIDNTGQILQPLDFFPNGSDIMSLLHVWEQIHWSAIAHGMCDSRYSDLLPYMTCAVANPTGLLLHMTQTFLCLFAHQPPPNQKQKKKKFSQCHMEIKEPPKLQQQNSDFLSIDQYFEEFDARLVLSYLNFNFQLHLTDAARQIIFYLKINITHVQFVIDNNSKFFKIILHYPTLTTHSTSSLYISLSFFIHLEVLTHIKTLAPLPSPTKKEKKPPS